MSEILLSVIQTKHAEAINNLAMSHNNDSMCAHSNAILTNSADEADGMSCFRDATNANADIIVRVCFCRHLENQVTSNTL